MSQNARLVPGGQTVLPFRPAGASTPVSAQDVPAGVNPQHYRIALQHAQMIQARKDVETLVLEALEEFLDFPTAEDASPASPSDQDLTRFQSLIQPFQASDYEELFVERNLVEKCGYVFCPRKPLREPHRGPVRLVPSLEKGGGLAITDAKHAEMWCSRDCAKRALYIKVQLSETAAWERIGGPKKPIEILDKRNSEAVDKRIDKLASGPDKDKNLEQLMSQLAIERGESVKPS